MIVKTRKGMEMKKLLVMILMVGVALPAFAKEVKLRCITDVSSGDTEIWSFDEAAGTVTTSRNGGLTLSTKDKCRAIVNSKSVCYEGYISTEAVGIKYFWSWKDEPFGTVWIDRMDGTRHADSRAQGTCVPFKQAF